MREPVWQKAAGLQLRELTTVRQRSGCDVVQVVTLVPKVQVHDKSQFCL